MFYEEKNAFWNDGSIDWDHARIFICRVEIITASQISNGVVNIPLWTGISPEENGSRCSLNQAAGLFVVIIDTSTHSEGEEIVLSNQFISVVLSNGGAVKSF